MTNQATLFYYKNFKDNYPNGKLYTYITNTTTPANTYNHAGVLNTNPVILDSNGQAEIYIDKDIVYNFTLYDHNNNLIYSMNNIKQLNGQAGTPGGPQGPTGPAGITGPQGIGIVGPQGPTGVTGDAGLPYYTAINTSSGGSFTIPAGIDTIYITASAGGGAGACWSPYTFIYDVFDTSTSAYTTNVQYLNENNNTTYYSLNSVQFPYKKLNGIIFTPGSGFSGQSVYRYKISLDKTQTNLITVTIGSGGTQAQTSTTLNGGDGQNTLIYVNGNLNLTLKGGPGGKNFFPTQTGTIPTIPVDGTPIQINKGYNSGLFVFQSSQNNTFVNNSNGLANQAYSTYYKKTDPVSIYSYVPIKLSYQVPLQTQFSTYSLDLSYTTNDLSQANKGERNIFDNYYSTYQNMYSYTSPQSTTSGNFYQTAIKGLSGSKGAGAGGDVFFNIASSQNNFNNGYMTSFMTAGLNNVIYVSLYNRNYIINKIQNYMLNFNTSDAYSTGVKTIPSNTDTTGVWNAVDNLYNNVIQPQPGTYIDYQGTNFYNIPAVKNIYPSQSINARGGAGVQGYCIIEYGNITDNSK